jgi:hypothetical protein
MNMGLVKLRRQTQSKAGHPSGSHQARQRSAVMLILNSTSFVEAFACRGSVIES